MDGWDKRCGLYERSLALNEVRGGIRGVVCVV
jgi:hypothetical protein